MDSIYILQRFIRTGVEVQQEILSAHHSSEDAKKELQRFWKKDKTALDIVTTLTYHTRWVKDENFEYDVDESSVYVANHLKGYIYQIWIEKLDVK
jgi:hypothetical protein